MSNQSILKIPTYDEGNLKLDSKLNNNRPYQQCVISVMDTIADPNIKFDENGISNYYYEYQNAEKNNVFKAEEGKQKLNEIVQKIREKGKGKKYDCILGLSGGADSSYLAILAKQMNLRPLIVHFDYGWNMELAVKNIENLIKKLNFELYTVVMDWEEMKSLQRSYYKSSVLDLDVPADHAIFGALFETAKKFDIKYILSGKNTVTECILPRAWNYNKFDIINLRDINKNFENIKLKKLPILGLIQFGLYQGYHQIQIQEILDYVNYNKFEVKKTLEEQYGWRDYGDKHFENLYTKLYQSYVLPVKFGIDKRKAHLSNLIFSNQISKQDALEKLNELPYNPKNIVDEIDYVSKKLGFSFNEFIELIKQPNKSHCDFKTDAKQKDYYYKFFKIVAPITKVIKRCR